MTIDTITTDVETIKKFIAGGDVIAAATSVEDGEKPVTVDEGQAEGNQDQKEPEEKGGKKGAAAQPAANKKQEKLKKADLEKLSLKAILSKMVPYINFPYAEHTLRKIGVSDPNARATDRDIDTLIKAA